MGLLTPSGNNTYATRATLGPTTSWTELNSPRYLFHNQAKGHVLGYLDGDFYAFDESTFAEDADVPSMSGITLQSISPALNGGEFIATNSSVQPTSESSTRQPTRRLPRWTLKPADSRAISGTAPITSCSGLPAAAMA